MSSGGDVVGMLTSSSSLSGINPVEGVFHGGHHSFRWNSETDGAVELASWFVYHCERALRQPGLVVGLIAAEVDGN